MIAIKKAFRRRLAKESGSSRLRHSNAQLHALTSYLQFLLEEERIRISREVHDVLGQRLTGLKLGLSWAARQIPASASVPLRRKLAELSDDIDATIQIVRRIATELRPQILDDLGLVAAIEWEAGEFHNRCKIPCKVTSRVGELVWDQDFSTVFFRVFQEMLTNVIRHAEATRVEVRLTQRAGRFALEVRDNGRGIAAEEIASTRSIGLIGMRERAALVGGEIIISGAPGRGTNARIEAPLPRAVRIKP